MRSFLAVSVHIWCEFLLHLIWGKYHMPIPYWHVYCAGIARHNGMTRAEFAEQAKSSFDTATEHLRQAGMI